MKEGICKFCNQHRHLVDSHIIPRSLYPKNENGDIRLKAISVTEQGPAIPIPNGMSDKELVCRECENHFDRYDDYAAKFSQQLNSTPILTTGLGQRYREINEYDPPRLQLFFLSLLWRAHATSLPAFQKVNLGPHADIIRKRIETDNAGLETEYRVMLFYFSPDENIFYDISRLSYTPIRRRTPDGVNCYVFWLFGYVACIAVDSQPADALSLSNVMKGAPLYIVELDARQSPFPKIMWDAMKQTQEFYRCSKMRQQAQRSPSDKI